MVNYDDFECPFCSRVHQTLFPQLLKEYGDRVAFIYKDFPLSEISSLGDSRRRGCELHCCTKFRCLLGLRRLHSLEPATVNKEANKDSQFAALDHMTLTEGDKFKLDSASCNSASRTEE